MLASGGWEEEPMRRGRADGMAISRKSAQRHQASSLVRRAHS